MPKHAANESQGTNPASRRQPPTAQRAERDERIGLTEAFSPVAADGEPGVPAASADGDEPIGLTQAFAPVDPSSASASAGAGAHAGGFSYRGDNDDEYPDAFESLEPHPEPPVLFDDVVDVAPEAPAARHGKEERKAKKDQIPAYLRKSRRMRRLLIVVVVLLVLLIAALGYFTFKLIEESQMLATQQAQELKSVEEVDALQDDDAKDAETQAVKKTEAPELTALLGLTQDQAVEALQRGATVTSSREVNEEGNPIKSTATVALTSEPADNRTGTPTVYLGMDEAGAVIQAGYSASVAALGYGDFSFSEAVKNENIVEKTLQEAGIAVPEGSAQLPEDKAAYSTYASDGKTLVKESCSFSGSVDIDGAPHEWSAVLSYDYSTANTSGNLADTIRIIYVYINA